MAAGYKVGVNSSPHLVRYTERVRVQGQELPESAHTASFVGDLIDAVHFPDPIPVRYAVGVVAVQAGTT